MTDANQEMIDHLRKRAKDDPDAPPVLFIKIECGGRHEDMALHVPVLLLHADRSVMSSILGQIGVNIVKVISADKADQESGRASNTKQGTEK